MPILIVELAVALLAVSAGVITYRCVVRWLARKHAPPPAEELIETVQDARAQAARLQREQERKAAEALAAAERLEQLKSEGSRKSSSVPPTRRV